MMDYNIAPKFTQKQMFTLFRLRVSVVECKYQYHKELSTDTPVAGCRWVLSVEDIAHDFSSGPLSIVNYSHPIHPPVSMFHTLESPFAQQRTEVLLVYLAHHSRIELAQPLIDVGG